MKYLIVGGDSFSAETFNWSYLLANRNNLICINNAVPSAGNDYISRSIIYSVQQKLEQGILPNDILVMPMWTYPDRKSFFINKDETAAWDILINSSTVYARNPVSFVERSKQYSSHYRFSGKPKDSGWVIGEGHSFSSTDAIGKFKEPYMSHYKTREGSIMETLEWILFVQNFCKSHNIRIINLAYSYESIFYYPTYHIHGDRKTGKHIREQYSENCSHLCRMIDYSSWITSGLLEYCMDNNLRFDDIVHPAGEAHIEYVKNIIEPVLLEKYYNV